MVRSAVVVVTTGCLITVVASLNMADRASAASQQQFETSATRVASTLRLVVESEQAFISDAAAIVSLNPALSNRQLALWVDATGAFSRYPDLQIVAEAVLIPAATLPAYERSVEADPTSILGPSHSE